MENSIIQPRRDDGKDTVINKANNFLHSFTAVLVANPCLQNISRKLSRW